MGTIPRSESGQISCHQASDQTQGTKHITLCYVTSCFLTIYINRNMGVSCERRKYDLKNL